MTTTPPNINTPGAWRPTIASPPVPMALTLGRRLMLPPAEAIRPHDSKVADCLHAIQRMEGEEAKAAAEY